MHYSQNKLLFFLLIISSLFCALSEGISVFLIFPLLAPDEASNFFSRFKSLDQLWSVFSNIEYELKIKILCISMIIFLIFRFIFRIIANYISINFPIKIQEQISKKFFYQILNADYQYISKEKTGNLLSNTLEHPAKSSSIIFNTSQIIINLFLILIYIIFLCFVSFYSIVMAGLFLSILFSISRKYGAEPISNWGKTRTNKKYNLFNLFNNIIKGIKYIKVRNTKDSIIFSFENNLKSYLNVSMKAQLLSTSLAPIYTTISAILIIISVLIGILTFGIDTQNNLWVEKLIIFVICLYRLLGPISSINEAWSSIDYNRYGHNEFKIKQLELSNSQENLGNLKISFKKIELRNLHFSYNKNKKSTLSGINLEFFRGKMYSIIGKSGSGKTTLINLLVGLLYPQTGEILIDGKKLSINNLNSWRKNIGLVSQETVLFNDTLINNITLGMKERITRKKINEILIRSGCNEFIEDLPNGIETNIGESGIKLSGGQQQRIALARCLISNPQILILDEATSNLDIQTEKLIIKNIYEFKRNKIIFSIAHRLETILNSDKIIHIDEGKLIGFDSFKNLNKKSNYFKLLIKEYSRGHSDTQKKVDT